MRGRLFNPIDETNLDDYIDAYAIALGALSTADGNAARQFIHQLGEGYLQQMEQGFRPKDGRWLNNWNSHRIKLATLAASALNDKALWERSRSAFSAHIARNIRTDGSVLDFEERDALHYVVYDLEPLIRAAQIARWQGEDWLTLTSASGSNLKAALDWLLPYASGKRTHEEFVHSHVKFVAERNAAGLPGYAGTWNPDNASRLYALAASLDKRYATVATLLRTGNAGSQAMPCWAP